MSHRTLQYLNLFGVLALAILCVVQWQRDRELNLTVNRLEQVRLEHVGKLSEQDTRLQALTADLEQFKGLVDREKTAREEAEQKFKAAQQQVKQLSLERDQLQTSVTNWANAVSVRDQRLKEANLQIEQLAANLNGSIQKYNELATNYNTVVKELNALRATAPTSQAN